MAKEVLNIDISDVKEMVQMMEKAESSAKGVGDAVSDLTSEYKQAAAHVQQMEEALNDAETSLAQMSEQTKGYDRLKEETEAFKEELESAKTELSQVEDEMQAVANDSDRTADEIDVSAGHLRSMANQGDRLRNKIKQTARQADRYAHSNAEARQSAMAVGNILSDLPHGMMAISNNVGELVEGFQGIETSGRSTMQIMKSMVGPALLGGLLTGVFTLASRWDKVSQKIESAANYLSGMSEAQIALNKAVDKGVEKRLTEAENLKKLTETQRDILLGNLKRRKLAREQALSDRSTRPTGRLGLRGGMKEATGDIPDALPSDLNKMLTTLTKMEAQTRRTREEIRKLLSGAGIPESQISGIISRLFAGEEKPDAPSVPLVEAGDAEVVSSGGGGSFDGTAVSELFAAMRKERKARRKKAFAQARRQIAATTAPGSIERARQMMQARRERELEGLRSRLSRLRRKRSSAPTGSAKERRLTAKIQSALAERLDVRRSFLEQKRKLQKREARREDRMFARRIGRMRQFSGSISRIGAALTSTVRQGVQNRISELQREGMAQAKARKVATKEARARFRTMKKIQIAGAIANTITAGVSAFRQTVQAAGPFGVAAGIAQMTAALASGYAQVRKLQQTKIGGGAPSGSGGAAAGGSLSSSFSELGTRSRNERVRNFARETATDQALRNRDGGQKAVNELRKIRGKMDEARAIGDEESFDSNEAAEDYRNKAVS